MLLKVSGTKKIAVVFCTDGWVVFEAREYVRLSVGKNVRNVRVQRESVLLEYPPMNIFPVYRFATGWDG